MEKCLMCKKEMEYSRQVFCSESCNDKYSERFKNYEARGLCRVCGGKVKPGKKYCSSECYTRSDVRIEYEKVLNRYRRSAFNDGLVFWLTLDVFIKKYWMNPCFYCGSISRHINRIDNSKGYTESNCVPSCKTCDDMKGKLTINEFLDKCKQVAIKHV